MSKSYQKKKEYRKLLKDLCKKGMMNDAAGKMVNKSSCQDNSMKTDYYPQR